MVSYWHKACEGPAPGSGFHLCWDSNKIESRMVHTKGENTKTYPAGPKKPSSWHTDRPTGERFRFQSSPPGSESASYSPWRVSSSSSQSSQHREPGPFLPGHSVFFHTPPGSISSDILGSLSSSAMRFAHPIQAGHDSSQPVSEHSRLASGSNWFSQRFQLARSASGIYSSTVLVS